MGLFKIEWKSSSERDLGRIDRQYIAKIIQAVELLGIEPLPVQSRKLQDAGSSYRLRVGETIG